MIESEDGTVVGSIDVSALDQLNPKSDEARAQVDALKRDIELGQKQAAADAERLAQAAFESSPLVSEPPQDNRDLQGKSTGSPEQSGHQKAPASETQSTTEAGTVGDPNPSDQGGDKSGDSGSKSSSRSSGKAS